MVRSYKRKTTRSSYGTPALQQALDAVKTGMSLKKAAAIYGIPRATIRRHRRHRNSKVHCPGTAKLGAFEPVLSPEFETELASQIQMMEHALFGLTTIDVRQLAFEFAMKMKLPNSFNTETKMGQIG